MSGMMGPGLALFRDLEDKPQRTEPRWVPDRFLSKAFVVPLKVGVKESSQVFHFHVSLQKQAWSP